MHPPDLITLGVEWFTYTDDVPPKEPFTWKKKLTQDLTMVFDTFRGEVFGSPSRVLKVLQGSEVLEELPIQKLITQTNDMIATMKRRRLAPTTDEELPIYALSKSPLLAICSATSTENQRPTKLRRIQVKFSSHEEFSIAHKHLSQLGLLIKEQQQRAQPPSTVNSSSQSHNLPNPSKPKASGPSFPPSRLAEISQLPTTSASITPSPCLQSVGPPFHKANDIRPASASAALMDREQNHQYTTTPALPNHLVPPVLFPRPASSSSTLGLGLPSGSTGAVTQGYPTPAFDFATGTGASSSRPRSAMLCSDFATSGFDIPPRRELPIGLTRSLRSAGSDASTPRTPISTMEMPPPPLPSPSRPVSRRSAKAFNDPLEVPPLPLPTIIEANENPVLASSPDRRPSPGSDFPHSSSTIGGGTRHDASPSGSERRPPSALSDTAQNSRPIQFQNPLHAPMPAASLNRVTSELHSAAAANDKAALATYAAQSEEERKAAVNDFIIQVIDDDNFRTLVEDTSICWSRIALGLG